ncbi:DEAD-domain-containing protein [Annulohypoxylon bovei var. microspora]|nr:DEAD-domain-containing protein [Annulohypoxylon bovei var. microspora]
MQEPHTTSSKPRRRPGRGKRHQQEFTEGFQESDTIMNDSQPMTSRSRAQNKGRNEGRHMQARAFSTSNTLRNAGSSAQAQVQAQVGTSGVMEALSSNPAPTDTPLFSDLAKDNLIHPVVLQTISQDLKFQHMTPVQAATIYPLLKDQCDILAQAKTGTGKTLAFLLPAIQRMIRREDEGDKRLKGKISLLVISPTRELAMQIVKEARSLLQRLDQFKVCIAIGGTNKEREEKTISQGCDILVATPGRLNDHLTTNGSPVIKSLQTLDTLVLDEADRLLDMGFIEPIKKIIRCLPPRTSRKRQGMLFSATVPEHVKKVAELALTEDFRTISTIAKGEVSTHDRVPQQLIVVPNFSDLVAGLFGAIRRERELAGPDVFKAIVFAPTAYLVEFYAQTLQQYPGLPTIDTLHSRMSQSKRTKITGDFHQAKSHLLFATDVIARGMDFPSVTNVFQIGIPTDKESYVHRLGRTARAGAEGRGTFIVTSHETWFPNRVLKSIQFEETQPDLGAHKDIQRLAQNLDPSLHEKTYQAWLGYYKPLNKQMGWDPVRLVQEANELALNGLGAAEVPSIKKSVVGKMGLKGTKGLNIRPDDPKSKREKTDGEGNWGAQEAKRPRTNGGWHASGRNF